MSDDLAGRVWPAISVVVLIILLLSGILPIAHVARVYAATPVVPPGILYYVPITITNSQSIPTPTPFQQMVSIDSSTYSSYEAPNLQNVEFFSLGGSVIPSWLESGNTNTAPNTVYWLEMTNGISAGSSVTVYMGFASLAANRLNSQTTGEAPQLSSAYGQYDDGLAVFPTLYQNFAGTTCPSGWNCSGVTPDNGISIPYPSYVITNSNSYGMNSTQILDFYGTFPLATQESITGFGFVGRNPLSSTQSVALWVIDNYYLPSDYAYGYVYPGSSGSNYAATSYSTTGENEYSIYWPSTGSVSFSYNYGTGITVPPGHTCICNLPIGGLSEYGPGTTIGPFYWVRIRAYPPNGVMPSVSIGTVTPAVSLSVACSPSPVVLGSSSSCIGTVTGNSPSGTVTWSTSGSGTFSPSSCTLSSGSCQASYMPSSASSPVTITASYGGDANNQPTSGTFSLSVSKAVATTAVTCSPSQVTVNTPTTCVATVAGYSPSGTIRWASSGVANFSPTSSCTLSPPSCSVTYTSSSPASPVTITATYSGDTNNTGSSGTFSLIVSQLPPTNTTISCSPSPVAVGAASSCTAKVTGGTPTGSVAFTSSTGGAFQPSTCTLSSGQCTSAYTPSTIGAATVTAVYSGDTSHQGSASTFSLVVTKASPTTSVVCTPSSVVEGIPTSCVATESGGYSPTGTVTFASSSNTGTFTPSNQCSLSSGTCRVSYYDTARGTPQVTATYGGDSNNGGSEGSTSLSVVSATTVSSTTMPSTTTSTSSSIPEFPYTVSGTAALVVIVVLAYALARRNASRQTPRS